MNVDEIQNVAEVQILAAGGDPAMLARWHTVYLLAQMVRINQPLDIRIETDGSEMALDFAQFIHDNPQPSPLAENARKVADVIAKQQSAEREPGYYWVSNDGVDWFVAMYGKGDWYEAKWDAGYRGDPVTYNVVHEQRIQEPK